MKKFFKKLWRLLNLDVLFLSLVEKITRGLSKKLTAFHVAVSDSLNRVLEKRNDEAETESIIA